MQATSEPRFRRRIPCQLEVGNNAYSGMVLNLSRGGLFVQTSAEIRPGDAIRVDLNLPSGPRPIELAGKIVWNRVVGARMRTMTQGGVGLQIRSAPETYYEYLLGVSGESAAQSFRVRVLWENGIRSRTLTVSGVDEARARRAALASLGEGWVILELERV